jgi:hypothetical protein
MITTIIYTYKKPLHKIYLKETNQKEWITKSIQSTRSLNYNIELYTNDIQFSEGLDIDKVHSIDDEYFIWDSFKLWVLENDLRDDYILCDNDVIFKERPPINDSVDAYFDVIEDHNWNWVYEPTMKYLKSNNIFSGFDFWKYNKMGVYNIGILKINNQELKQEYIRYWKELYEEIKPHLNSVDKSFTTPIITQYLLTLLIQKGNYTHQHFTNGWPYGNDYYNHYPGFLKVKNSNII